MTDVRCPDVRKRVRIVESVLLFKVNLTKRSFGARGTTFRCLGRDHAASLRSQKLATVSTKVGVEQK